MRNPRKAAAPPGDDKHGDAGELGKVSGNPVWVARACDIFWEPDRAEELPHNNPADSL